MSESPWELHIATVGEAGYHFTLGNPRVGALKFTDDSNPPRTVRLDVLEMARPPEDSGDLDGWLERLGRQIADGLLPPSIRSELGRLEGGHLEISTDDPEVPWECAWAEGGPLCRRVAVGRRLHVASPPASIAAPPDRRWMEMLIVTNPTGDLSEAGNEGELIRDILVREPLIRVTLLSGCEATSKKLFEALGRCRYDVFHYAGHVAQGPGAQGDHLELFDGPVSATYLAGRFHGAPEIAFVNGCKSGRSDQRGTRVAAINTRTVAGTAQAFLSAGVRSYVGTLWDVQDSAASELATSFYQEVVGGATIGSALLQARGTVAARGAVAWGAHVLFGRPTDVLVGIQPAIERQRNLRRLREAMAGGSPGRRRRAALLLGELSDAEATGALVEAMDDDSEAVQWRAVVGLAKIGSPESVQALMARLPSASPSLALHILVMLREVLSADVSAAVRALAETTTDRAVLANALITLGGTGAPLNSEFFAQHLDGDELMQLLAMEGLARIGKPALKHLYNVQPTSAELTVTKQRLVKDVEDGP